MPMPLCAKVNREIRPIYRRPEFSVENTAGLRQLFRAWLATIPRLIPPTLETVRPGGWIPTNLQPGVWIWMTARRCEDCRPSGGCSAAMCSRCWPGGAVWGGLEGARRYLCFRRHALRIAHGQAALPHGRRGDPDPRGNAEAGECPAGNAGFGSRAGRMGRNDSSLSGQGAGTPAEVGGRGRQAIGSGRNCEARERSRRGSNRK